MLSPFAERLRDYLRAGYPALAVLTHEEERLLGDLRTLRAIGWSFVAWSIARGWVDAIIPPTETREILLRALALATRPAAKAAFQTGVLQV